MTASVIIPCYRCEATLPRTLASIDQAAQGLSVERVIVDDATGRGLSWARNEGLKRARGEVIFFVDADDTVRPNYFRLPLQRLAETGADFLLSSFDYAPLKRSYELVGNRAIREAMLPAFLGYSFEDVRRWNAGGDLMARREQGGVWRGAFRRDFLVRHQLCFDEQLRLYEDSPFIAACALYATRVTSLAEVLYNYEPGPQGLLRSSLGTVRYWQYKFAALANRKALDARVGGGVLPYFAASSVFSALELARARQGVRRYVRDPFVAASLRAFPLSWRHLGVALGVGALRLLLASNHSSQERAEVKV